MNIYEEIYPLCEVRDDHRNLHSISNRGQFLIDLFQRYELEYEIVDYFHPYQLITNFLLKGDSDKFLCAHYDVANTKVDNANDNSASIINALAYKLEDPKMNVWITDIEEFGGMGADLASHYMSKNNIPCDWVLNLELTGYGRFAIVDMVENKLTYGLDTVFNPSKVPVPFNDSMIFRQNGYDSKVITMCPELGYTKHLFDCHTERDTVDKINIDDMKDFVSKLHILTNS